MKFICVIIIANTRNRENNGFHVERRMNMKVSNIKDIDKFFAVVDSCEGRVELVTGEGDRLNLKSKLSQYVSLANIFSNGEIPELEIVAYEKEAMDQLGLIPEIAPRYRTTYFNHIIGGYAAGYYSYLWANVLDNDAFEAFKEHGIFDKQTADLFRQNVLEKGDSEDPMTLYKNFRGTEPQLGPMLKNRGMK